MSGTTACAALAALTLGLAGCSSPDARDKGRHDRAKASPTARERAPFEGMTAGQITGLAMETARSLTSVTVDLREDSGDSLRLAMSERGECEGSMVVKGVRFRVVITPRAVHWKADWRKLGGPRLEAALGDRWIRAESGSPGYRDFDHCVMDDFLPVRPSSPPRPLTRGAATTIDGRTVVPVIERGGGEQATMYVAAEGRPYVHRLVLMSEGATMTMAFSGFDEPVTVRVPPASEVVDSSQAGKYGRGPLQAAASRTPPPDADAPSGAVTAAWAVADHPASTRRPASSGTPAGRASAGSSSDVARPCERTNSPLPSRLPSTSPPA
ncbi:hypothetical protein [Streptomyces capparidis]